MSNEIDSPNDRASSFLLAPIPAKIMLVAIPVLACVAVISWFWQSWTIVGYAIFLGYLLFLFSSEENSRSRATFAFILLAAWIAVGEYVQQHFNHNLITYFAFFSLFYTLAHFCHGYWKAKKSERSAEASDKTD